MQILQAPALSLNASSPTSSHLPEAKVKLGKKLDPLRPAELQIVRNEQKIGLSPRHNLSHNSQVVLTDETSFHPAAPLWLTTDDAWAGRVNAAYYELRPRDAKCLVRGAVACLSLPRLG